MGSKSVSRYINNPLEHAKFGKSMHCFCQNWVKFIKFLEHFVQNLAQKTTAYRWVTFFLKNLVCMVHFQILIGMFLTKPNPRYTPLHPNASLASIYTTW